MEELRFKLERKQVRVVLENNVGVEAAYLLTEMDGKDRNVLQEALKERVEISDGKAVVKRIDGLENILLSLCLTEEASGDKVPLETVETWPASVVEALGQKASEINGITSDAAEKAGNA